jgi:hypothetical protein
LWEQYLERIKFSEIVYFFGLFASYILIFFSSQKSQKLIQLTIKCSLNQLLESAIDRRADIWDALPEVNSGDRTLADTLWCEFKLL